MKNITVNSISQQYEKLYKKFKDTSTQDETFFSINNAMIFAYFIRYVDVEYKKDNYAFCCKCIENHFGSELFFYNIKKTDKYKENLNTAIETFMDMFKDTLDNKIPLESILGNVLEKHINQKKTGSYYTPADTTSYISWKTIIFSSINKSTEELKTKILTILGFNTCSDVINSKYTFLDILEILKTKLTGEEKTAFISVIYSLKIIDPTCGSGAFVMMAFECLETIIKHMSKEVDYKKILECLYGVDISREAIQLTKLRLLMNISKRSTNLQNFNEIFKNNFIVGDALKGSDFIIEEEGFDWKNFGIKFDCVIGNPPYVEMKKYVSENFLTQKCGNLYAYTIERACNIVSDNGMISFIVPLPLVATPRMQVVKSYLEEHSKRVYYSTFADRPGCIFTGVHQRLTIFFAEIGKVENTKIFSSSYKYWYNDERKELFNSISYYENKYKGILPKIGNEIEDCIYSKIISNKHSILDMITDESEYPIYLSTRIGFWTKAFLNNVFSSKEYKTYFAKDIRNKYTLVAILNSSTFYYYWVISSDCWHITSKDLLSFKFDLTKLDDRAYEKLMQKCECLMESLEENKKYIGSKQTLYEYKHKLSKDILDEIDDILCPIFGFDKTELEYIKRYTEKYRVNKLEV